MPPKPNETHSSSVTEKPSRRVNTNARKPKNKKSSHTNGKADATKVVEAPLSQDVVA